MRLAAWSWALSAFKEQSIRHRIVSFFAASMGAISLLVFLLVPKAIEREAESALQTQAQSIGSMVAHSVAAPMVFGDSMGISEALAIALADEGVVAVELADGRGGVLLRLTRDNAGMPGRDLRDHSVWEVEHGAHGHDADVVLDGDALGVVHLDLSTAGVEQAVHDARRIVGLVSVLLFMIGTFVAVRIAKVMTAPLAGVARAAERIAEGDRTSRAEVPSQDEVGQLAQSFNRMVDELQVTQERLIHSQKMQSVGQLAGGVAHDFNNLLTTIMGSADILLFDLPEGHSSREEVQDIQRAGERLAGLTRQLLAFSRKQVTQLEVIDVSQAVADVEKMLRRLLGSGLSFETSLEPNVHPIHADPGQLEQVLVNLVVNAKDAMPEGGALGVETRSIDLSEPLDTRLGEPIPAGSYAVLAVSDTGVGIDDEWLPRIFEPFYTRKAPGKGTGLGLSTVYGIVNEFGGHIDVDSSVGKGTTFTIFFPKTDVEPRDADAPVEQPAAATGVGTVLVVDDEDSVRSLTKRFLERSGYNVLAVSDGETALRRLAESSDVDLLLTDVVMPGMSGAELSEAVSLIYPELPIAFMSGFTDDQLHDHGILGQDFILVEKPFTSESLATSVQRALGNRSALTVESTATEDFSTKTRHH